MTFEICWLKHVSRATAAVALLMLGAAEVELPVRAAEAAPALTNWQWALASFDKAGALIAQGKYPSAKTELSFGATNLPAPYRVMAGQYLERLEAALKLSPKDPDKGQLSALVELCSDMRAYPATVQLLTRLRKTAAGKEATQDLLAWRLLESGDRKAALKEYERKLAEEQVAVYQNYYKKQIEFIRQRPANLTNVQFAIDYVREHYLKGFEEHADYLSSLKELNRVLPYAKTAKESLALYQEMIKNLSALDDEPGLVAWEDKLLNELKSDRDAGAAIYLARGVRAYRTKNIPEALADFRKVCAEHADSSSYGDAQYDVGLLLQEQRKYDEAIPEYAKLFTSGVNDYLVDPESTEDLKNYRHKAAARISECYEAKNDYAHALEYAQLARDRYQYLSWCKACLDTVHEELGKRIKDLQAMAKKPSP